MGGRLSGWGWGVKVRVVGCRRNLRMGSLGGSRRGLAALGLLRGVITTYVVGL
jgi:hypothetical protein